MTAEVSVVVPTLGRVPGLGGTLRALRQPGVVETVVVSQGPAPGPEADVDRSIRLPAPVGFAAAANRGIEVSRGRFVLLLNDDARLPAGALERLASVLEASPETAAVQPSIRGPAGRVDSLGIGWNRWWQAVQRGHGSPPAATPPPEAEVFGAHAAVALYRRRALEGSARDGRVFEEVLDTYYEDVELAGRLRAGGWRACLVGEAEAEHRGGASADALGKRGAMLLVRNRLLVLARFFGPELRPLLPRVLTRDVLDGLRSPGRWPAILAGWRRARAMAPGFARAGGYRMPPGAIREFQES